MVKTDFILVQNILFIFTIIILIYIIAALLPFLTGTVAGGFILLGVGAGIGAAGIYIIIHNWNTKKEKSKTEKHSNED